MSAPDPEGVPTADPVALRPLRRAVHALAGQGRGAAFALGAAVGALAVAAGLLWPQTAGAVALFLAAVSACLALALAAALVTDRRQRTRLAQVPRPVPTVPAEAEASDGYVEELLEADSSPRRLALSRAIAIIAIDCQLTPREREVLVLLVRGRDVRHISEALVVSVNTVRTHIQKVYSKLGVHSRQELIDHVEAFACDAPEGARD